jgi:adenylate kinase
MSTRSKKLLFIGGVHGSGKTTIGTKAAVRLGADFKSCSQIIRTERQTQSVSTPGIADVEINQQALIAGIKRLKHSDVTVMLDGHFTLKTITDGIQPIPLLVFEAMLPDVLFLVETSSSSICSRLTSRDGVITPESEIRIHQEHERRCATLASRHLGLPLIVLNGDDDNAYQSAVNAVQQGVSLQ